MLFEVHYAILSISSKFFLLIKKTNEGKGMILMENDCIPVNRKILYNDSLNCKEKIALIILLDTEAGSISYDHLAKKMDVTKPTAIATIKSLKDKGFLKCNLGQFTRNYTQTTKRGLLTTKQAEYQAPGKCKIFSLFCCLGFPKGLTPWHTTLLAKCSVLYALSALP